MIHQSVARKAFQGITFILLTLVFLSSCGANLMPTKDSWYTQHYYIMQDFERTVYRTISKAGKIEFQNLFWTARDPDSRKVFQERLSYITNAYKRENSHQPWNTDRGRIYLLNGPPAAIDIDQNTDWGTKIGQAVSGGVDRSNEDVQAYRVEVWTYSFRKQYVKYSFMFVAPNEWKMAPALGAGNKFLGELEAYNRTVTFGIRNPENYNQDLEALEKKK
jgi:GWxTD domain-containing protein